MALQLGSSFRRSLLSGTKKTSLFSSVGSEVSARRFKSTDAGDVIGIDLGTTNSCVAVMVSTSSKFQTYGRLFLLSEKILYIFFECTHRREDPIHTQKLSSSYTILLTKCITLIHPLHDFSLTQNHFHGY